MTDDIEMINEPLLTEEGFVNQAAINELFGAIKSMPPTCERLSDDPEWTERRWVFLHDITGALAKWAIRQSPYACPDDLETAVKFLDACLCSEAKKLPNDDVLFLSDGIMMKLSLCEVNRMLHDILMSLPQVKAWNQPKDGDCRDITFCSRNGSDASGPDNDFIDINALLHNVCIDIRSERRESDLFDEKFKEEYGDLPGESDAQEVEREDEKH